MIANVLKGQEYLLFVTKTAPGLELELISFIGVQENVPRKMKRSLELLWSYAMARKLFSGTSSIASKEMFPFA